MLNTSWLKLRPFIFSFDRVSLPCLTVGKQDHFGHLSGPVFEKNKPDIGNVKREYICRFGKYQTLSISIRITIKINDPEKILTGERMVLL